MVYKKFSPTIQKKQKFAVFDIETYDWVNPYAVGFFDGEIYKEFLGRLCIPQFLKEVIRHKYRAYTIFAHNGGRFDFNFLMEVLKNWNYDINMIFQGSRCLNIKVFHQKEGKNRERKSRNCTKFSDSVALLRFKLDDLTKNFNVEHKKLNFMDKPNEERDYIYLYELYKKNDPRFHDYLKNDVLGLYEVLFKFNDLIRKNNGMLGLTIASTSLKTFQTGFLTKKIKMTNRKSNDEMKQSYYGGRTEIFKLFLDENKYRCYDVNSLYPHVMFENRFPISKPRTIHNPNIQMIKELDGITQCEIKAPDKLYLPILPYKLDMGTYKKLMFPLGAFKGYWDNVELRKAIELGYKVQPQKMFIFETDYIFKEYIKRFYELKRTSKQDTPSYILAKLMMNALYGKFAQSQDSEMVVKIDDPKEMLVYDITGIVDIDHRLFRVKSESKGNFFIPQISIHVTALARLKLYEYLEYLLDKGYEIAYCDTDSLFTDGTLPTSDKLGAMKKEYDFIKGYFLLPKTYCIVKKDGKIKIRAKGYTHEFQNMINENSFKKALFKKDYKDFQIEAKEPSFNTMRTSIVRHHNFVSTDIKKKSLHSIYDKRIVLHDYETTPLIV